MTRLFLLRHRLGSAQVPHSLKQAVGLFAVTCIVRGLATAAALALAYHVGTSVQMDQYIAFTLVVGTLGTLMASPLPVLVSQTIARVHSLDLAAQTCRRWARTLQKTCTFLYLALCPLLAWLFTPTDAGYVLDLLGLLLLGLPAVMVAPRVATEQALLQARGRTYAAVWCAGVATGTSLLAAALCGYKGGVFICAVGLSLGAWAELALLRRISRAVEDGARAPESVDPFPWKGLLVLLGASSSALLLNFYDQALLAQMGTGAQASWGLAGRAPSYLAVCLGGVAGILSSATLARAHTAGRLRTEAVRLFVLVVAMSLVVMAALFSAAEPLTRILYERGAFTPADTKLVANATLWTILGYLTYPAASVLTRAVGLLHAHRALLISAGGYAVVKVSVALAFVPKYGVAAVGASTLCGGIIQMLLLSRTLRQV
jgi:peptidoglycan biosynthesis protein MviN/MurJ (putative lipid II flippase)